MNTVHTFNAFFWQQVKDPKSHQDFVSAGVVDDEKRVAVYYAGNFDKTSNQYETVAALKFNSDSQAQDYIKQQEALTRQSTEPPPIVFRSKVRNTLHDVFFGESEYGNESVEFDCYVGFPSDGSKPFMTANMKVMDVPRYEHFDEEDYPECSSYFMYGNKKTAFLFHIPTKKPDFLQVILTANLERGILGLFW